MRTADSRCVLERNAVVGNDTDCGLHGYSAAQSWCMLTSLQDGMQLSFSAAASISCTMKM